MSLAVLRGNLDDMAASVTAGADMKKSLRLIALTMGLGQDRAHGDKAVERNKHPSLATPPEREMINGINPKRPWP